MQKVLSSIAPPFCNVAKITLFQINNFKIRLRFNLSHNQKSVTLLTGTHKLVIILFDVIISKWEFP